MEQPQEKFSGYRVIFGACLIGLVNLGSTSIFSIFTTDMAAAVNTDVGSLMYLVSICTVVAVVVGFLLGKILEKVSVRVCLAVATLCAAANCALASVAPNVFVMYICGALSGIDLAIGTTAALTIVVNEWFIEKRSQMMGIVVGVMSLGSVIMLFLASRVAEVADWRAAEMVCAAVIAVIGLAGNFFFIRSPEELGEHALGYGSAAEQELAGEAEASASSVGVDLGTAVKTFSFWAIAIATVLLTMGAEGANTYGPTFYKLYGVADLTASNLGMLNVALLFVSSIVVGSIGERYGIKALTSILCIALGGGLALYFLWATMGAGTGFLTLAVIIGGIGGPAAMLLTPALCADVFGPAHYDAISPILVSCSYLGTALSAGALNVVLAATGELKGYYLLFGACAFVMMVILFASIARSPLKGQEVASDS